MILPGPTAAARSRRRASIAAVTSTSAITVPGTGAEPPALLGGRESSGRRVLASVQDGQMRRTSDGTGTSAGWSQTFPQGQVKRRVVIRDSEAVESLRSKVGPFGHQINWENDAGALEPALLYRITVPRRSTDYNAGCAKFR